MHSTPLHGKPDTKNLRGKILPFRASNLTSLSKWFIRRIVDRPSKHSAIRVGNIVTLGFNRNGATCLLIVPCFAAGARRQAPRESRRPVAGTSARDAR